MWTPRKSFWKKKSENILQQQQQQLLLGYAAAAAVYPSMGAVQSTLAPKVAAIFDATEVWTTFLFCVIPLVLLVSLLRVLSERVFMTSIVLDDCAWCATLGRPMEWDQFESFCSGGCHFAGSFSSVENPYPKKCIYDAAGGMCMGSLSLCNISSSPKLRNHKLYYISLVFPLIRRRPLWSYTVPPVLPSLPQLVIYKVCNICPYLEL